MDKLTRLVLAALCLFAPPALAQQAGTVSNMPYASTPFNGSELLYVVQSGVSKKTNVATLSGALNALTVGATPIYGGTSGNCLTISSGLLGSGACGNGGTPGGGFGQSQYNNNGVFGGYTVSGDGSLNTTTGVLTVLSTAGSAFGALATLTPGTGVATALANAANAVGGVPAVNGVIVTGDCLQWGPGVQDAGATCGTGSGSSGTVIQSDALTVTATNTLSALSKTPVAGLVTIYINGVAYNNVGASPPFTYSGTTVTWSPTNSGINLATTDTAAAVYTISNAGLTFPQTVTGGVSGAIPYFSSTTVLSVSGLLAANALMVGGGAGAAPSTVTTGTGVLTALGLAANASGAFATVNGTIVANDCLKWSPTAGVTDAGAACGSGGGGSVTSVGNATSDTSLTIAGTGSGPYTGSVTAKLNLANANTWTAAQTATAFIANETISGSLNAGAFSYGTLPYSDTNIVASFAANVNSYAQIIVNNASSGASASSDFIAGNNNTTATTYYVDLGINSSGFSGAGSLALPNASYLTATTGDLVIGTTTSNAIHFIINSGATDAMSISTSGALTINGTLIISGGAATAGLATVTSAGVVSSAAQATLAQGGTNASLTASNGGIVYSTASAFAVLAGTGTSGQCLLSGSSAAPAWGSCSGAAAVSSVSNSDGTLTISPTTGAVVASLALGHANTWTAAQTHTGASPQIILGVAGATAGGVQFLNATSGSITLAPATGALGTVTVSIPAITDTLVTLTATQTLTNKSIAASEINSGTLAVAQGGTGQGSALTQYGVVYASTTSAMATTAAGTTSGVLQGNAAGAPTWVTTLSSTIQGNITALGVIATGTWQGTLIGATYGGTGVNNGSATLTLAASLTTTGTGAPTLAFPATTSYTYTHPANSGTLAEIGFAQSWSALQTFATGDLAINGGATTAGVATVSSAGVISSEAQVTLAQGGTNASLTASNGGIFYSTASAGAILAGTATSGQCLLSGSNAAPSWGSCGLSSISFPQTVAGTTTSGGIPYFSSTTVLSSSAALAANAIVVGGGAGVAPSTDASATLSAGALSLGSSGTAGSVILGNATSGTATLAPVTGALGTVTASLPANTGTLAELNLAQTWTAVQTFTNSDIRLLGSSTGYTTFTSGNASATNYTITLPAVTDTVAVLGTADQTLSGGATLTSYANTTGSVTIDCGKNPAQYIANTGAFTITAPTSDGECILQIENGAGAGAVTWSGFSEGSNTGDSLTTTNGSYFQISITRIHAKSHYLISALQ